MENVTKRWSFKRLKDSMEITEFEGFCKRIALEYANTDKDFSRSYFVKKYNISVSCFYKILETAVINNWVSDEIVDMMEEKAYLNQKANAEKAGLSTRIHYSNLRKERNEYLVSLYSNKEIEELVTEFAHNTQISKKQFAKNVGVPVIVLDMLLKKSIVELIVDDTVFLMIKERSMINADERSKEITERFFYQLAKQRNSKMLEMSSL